MSKESDDEHKYFREKANEALSKDDVSPRVRVLIIEWLYSLPSNIDGLKTDLYYDLLEKYVTVRQQNRYLSYELEEYKTTCIPLSEKERYIAAIEQVQKDFSKKAAHRAMKALADCIDYRDASSEAKDVIKQFQLRSSVKNEDRH